MTELPIDENTPRILIVEDEPKLGQLLIDYLRAASYAPTLISHGDQVLPYVRQTPPDLILLDLMLPGTDGLTLCREIRRFSDIPIVMVTAKIEEIDRLLGLEIGADDYICKPYSPREVVARVKTILRRCKPQRELQQQVLVATTLGLSLVTLLFMTTALLGWYYVLPFVLFLQGMVNSTRFSSMNTLTLKDLPDNLASSGNSLLSMIMQLSMSIGVTIAGLLLGLFGSQHVSVDSGTTQTVFMYTWLSMAFIIALPAFVFARVPNDTHQNVAISRRKRSAQ